MEGRRVSIVKKGNGKLTKGTKLVRDLIRNPNTLVINQKHWVGSDGYPHGLIGAGTGTHDPNEEKKFSNGVGGNTSTTFGVGDAYWAKDPKTGKYSEEHNSLTELFNHEFIHALVEMNGDENKPSANANNDIVYHEFYDGKTGRTERMDIEEARTVGFVGRPPGHKSTQNPNGIIYPTENELRNEQNRKTRLDYDHENNKN